MIIYLSILSDVLLSLRKKKVGENQRSYETISFLNSLGENSAFQLYHTPGFFAAFLEKKNFFFLPTSGVSPKL